VGVLYACYDAVLAVGMIEFDGIFILIGYAMVVATTLVCRSRHLGNAGKLGQTLH